MHVGVGSREYFEQLYASRTWEYYRPVLAHIIANSVPGPILDLGAGTGLLVEAATRWDSIVRASMVPAMPSRWARSAFRDCD